jgi:hypothetical protein
MNHSTRLPATLACVLLLLVGCELPAEQGSAPPQAEDSTQAAASSRPGTTAQCDGPLEVAMMQDKSRSSKKYRTSQLKTDDLTPIIERLRACGGELAVGIIKAESNQSLARLYVPAPNLKPLPEAPSREEAGNAFDYHQAMKQYKKARAKAKKARQATREQHRREVERRVKAFKAEVAKLLKTAPAAAHTDVWGGIRRAELFLAEPNAGYDTPLEKAMIIVSDARDNAGKPPVEIPLESGAQVLLVNGAPSLGSLKKVDPTRFESIAGAVRYWKRAGGS